MIVALAIVLISTVMVGTFAASHSRAERARDRAQLIADFAATLARAHAVSSPTLDTNVVSLEAFRMRRPASTRAALQSQSQRATR